MERGEWAPDRRSRAQQPSAYRAIADNVPTEFGVSRARNDGVFGSDAG